MSVEIDKSLRDMAALAAAYRKATLDHEFESQRIALELQAEIRRHTNSVLAQSRMPSRTTPARITAEM